MKREVYHNLLAGYHGDVKKVALLIDPDDFAPEIFLNDFALLQSKYIDFIFVGGSLVTSNHMQEVVSLVKKHSNLPCVIFPGNAMQIDASADAILFLSLISGRNPEFLIGQHVVSAPIIKRSQLEVLPTGYMLINSGRATSVSYMSNTTPLPNDKPSLAASTAMAGEMLGLQVLYMDAGSGADYPVSSRIIRAVRNVTNVPLIVGGGLDSKEKIKSAFDAGADVVVIGNGVQKNPDLMTEVSELMRHYRETLNVH